MFELETVENLYNVLEKYTQEALIDFATTLHFDADASALLTESELYEQLNEFLLRPEILRENKLLFQAKVADFKKHPEHSSGVQVDAAIIAYELGYSYRAIDSEGVRFFSVQAIMDELGTPDVTLDADLARFNLIRTLLTGAVNLYGAIDIEQFLTLVTNHFPGDVPLTLAELNQQIARYERTDFPIRSENLLVVDYLLTEEDGDELLVDLLEKQAETPYYHPTLATFTAYAGDHSFEENEALSELKTLLSPFFKHSTLVTDFIDMTVFQFQQPDFEPLGLIPGLASDNITFRYDTATIAAMQIFTRFYNNQRLWIYRGQTPTEVGLALKATAFIPKNLINRNDLCPCGSGQKYKKCCL